MRQYWLYVAWDSMTIAKLYVNDMPYKAVGQHGARLKLTPLPPAA